jgi:hypothetical protein
MTRTKYSFRDTFREWCGADSLMAGHLSRSAGPLEDTHASSPPSTGQAATDTFEIVVPMKRKFRLKILKSDTPSILNYKLFYLFYIRNFYYTSRYIIHNTSLKQRE